MTIRPIIIAPDKRLKLRSNPVEDVDEEIRTLLDDMLETMYGDDGLGLAAIQVGVPKRVVVIDVHERTNGKVVSDIDWIGEDGSLLARLEGYESVVDSGLSEAFRQNRLDESAPTRA